MRILFRKFLEIEGHVHVMPPLISVLPDEKVPGLFQ